MHLLLELALCCLSGAVGGGIAGVCIIMALDFERIDAHIEKIADYPSKLNSP